MNNTYELSYAPVRIYEMSAKALNGRRTVKFVIHEIFSSSEQYQDNGISWNEQYTINAMPSINGMSFKAEFMDSDRDMPLGHGMTGIQDGKPVFQNAVVVGFGKNPKVEDVTLKDKSIRALTAEAEIDELTYPNFVKWMEEQFQSGQAVTGSVEILSQVPFTPIIYDGGYKEKGRVPQEYIYGGFAVISIEPADKSAVMLELNNARNKEISREDIGMDEKNILAAIDEVKNKLAEINTLETKITEINTLNTKIAELNASVEQLQSLLEQTKLEREEAYKKVDKAYEEADELRNQIKVLESAISEQKVQEKLKNLDAELSKFTEDETKAAGDLISQYQANPDTVEINSIIEKIKAAKFDKLEAERLIAEENAKKAKEKPDDIFGDVVEANNKKQTAYDESGLF